MEMEPRPQQNHFKNEVEVTCYTATAAHPTPSACYPHGYAGKNARARTSRNQRPGGPAPADQILDKYYLSPQPEAPKPSTNQDARSKGNRRSIGPAIPDRIYSEAPEKNASPFLHLPLAKASTAFTVKPAGSPRRAASIDECQRTTVRPHRRANYFPPASANFTRSSKFSPANPSTANATFSSHRKGAATPPLRLYFDQQTGLLIFFRLIRYTETSARPQSAPS